MFVYAKVFGERNSGTIYLTALIRENTNAIIMEGDTRGKAGSLKATNDVFPGAYTTDNDYVQDLDHARTLHGDFGWKHAAPPMDVIEFSPLRGITKLVLTAKHPCFWLQSIYKRPYNPRLGALGTFSEFIRTPWPLSKRDGLGLDSLATPVDLFNRKIKSYIETMRRFPSNSTFVRYEDLLEDTEASVKKMCEGVLGAGAQPFKNIMRSTKSADENFGFYKAKYLSEDYATSISAEDLAYISSRLNPAVMKFCGYSVKAGVVA